MYKDYPKFAWFVVFAALALPFGVAFAVDRWGGPEDQIGIVVTLLLFEMALIRRVVLPNDSSFLGSLRMMLIIISCMLATQWRPGISALELLYDQRLLIGLATFSSFAGWIFSGKENRVLGFSFDRNFVGVVWTVAFLIGFNHLYINSDDQDFAALMDVVFCAAMANSVWFIPTEGEENTLVRVALGSVSFAMYIGFLTVFKTDILIWTVAWVLPVSSVVIFIISAIFLRK